ncbi:hypothetical protein ACOBQX_06600 [Actinokineospora sp. G85]|uniref:hypothetical protein n=1 Tax=Actinokineospora sp. G85 TaxID=3406626 RepID=UPI003C742F3D
MNVSGTRKRRRLAVQSALTAVVLGAVAGGIYYTTGAATAGDTPLASSFTCGLPDGEAQVPIEFGVTVPEQAATGAAVSVTPRATVTLPAAVVGKLRAGGEAVDATVTPKMTLTEGGARTDLQVAPLSVKAMSLPAEGDAVLDVPGTAVQVTPKSTGTATVELTGLTAALVVGETKVDCAATTSQGALGTFEVTQQGDTVKPPAQAPQQQAAPPAGGGISTQEVPGNGLPYNFNITITTKLPKVGAEIVLSGRLLTKITIAPGPDGLNEILGELNIQPADTYMVVFRFMPVNNTVSIIPTDLVRGKGKLSSVGPIEEWFVDSKVNASVNIKVSNLRQDGVPIDVGPNCGTSSPVVVPVEGKIKIAPGQKTRIETTTTIPPFAGCRNPATGEDLSKLLTGLVSGSNVPIINDLESTGTT